LLILILILKTIFSFFWLFCARLASLEKSANVSPQNFVINNFDMGVKNAVDANFESIEKVVKKSFKESY
jgi:hypothetical protein